MNNAKELIGKKEQQKIIKLIEDDKISEAINAIDNYFLFDKSVFNRLVDRFMASTQGSERRDIIEQLRVFVHRMHKPPETNNKGLTKVSEKIISPVTTFILGILSIVIGLWTNLIPPEIYKTLKAALGDYYIYVWVGAGLILIGVSLYLRFSKKHIKSKFICKKQEFEASQRTKFIDKLEKEYTNSLKQKLDDFISIELIFEEINENTREDNSLFLKKTRIISDKFVELTEKHPHILILGKPGAGKTCSLLVLAKNLLVKAKNNEFAAIPIVFNLMTWNETYDDLEIWLIKTLVELYNLPKALAHTAIVENKIIPLLDGFDEIGAHLDSNEERNQLRNECLNSITFYQNQRYSPKQFVMCSRIEEYKLAGGDARVDLKIMINDITIEKVIEALEFAKEKRCNSNKGANNNAAINLLFLIDKYPLLKKVLQTPFYFNAAMQTFHYRTDKNLKLPSVFEEIKHFIVNEFVKRKLANKANKYGIQKTINYLSWLSSWLLFKQIASFELTHFQPKDLHNFKFFGIAYGLVNGTIHGIIWGSVFGLLINWTFGLTFGLALGFLNGLLAGLSFSPISGFFRYRWWSYGFNFRLLDTVFGKPKIETEDIKVWKLSKLAKFSVIINILLFSLVSVFIGSAVGIHIYSIFNFFMDIEWTIKLFLAIGCLGLTFGFFFALHAYASETKKNTSTKKSFHRLSGNLLKQLLAIASISVSSLLLIISIFVEITQPLETGLVIILYGIIVFVLSIMSTSLFQHFLLAILLYRENKAPLRMAQFYNYCSELCLLERDGGSWRFRHKIIHDYFLNLEKIANWKQQNFSVDWIIHNRKFVERLLKEK